MERETLATDTPFHAMGIEESLAAAKADAKGLSEAEARARRARWGANRLPEGRRVHFLWIFARQFASPFILLLMGAAVLSLALGDWADMFFISLVLLVNGVVGAAQEWQAERQSRALQSLNQTRAHVLRDGRARTMDAEELVPGDIVTLQSGDRVPADLRLLAATEFMIDESLLTGESEPVQKNAQVSVDADAALGDRLTMAFTGTAATAGRAQGLVVATGAHTQIGRIAASLGAQSPDTPLIIRMKAFSRLIALLSLGVILLLWGIESLRGADWIEMLLLAIALAVAAIPEGLPVAMTVVLSISVRRMAARRVLVRALPAVEGLGACTLIASDKTGTLTQNVLTVVEIWTPEDGQQKAASDTATESARAALHAAMMANEAQISPAEAHENDASAKRCEGPDGAILLRGDTVDIAFLESAMKRGLDRASSLEAEPEIARISYEPARRFGASFHRRADGQIWAYAKGALETLALFCDDDERLDQADQAMNDMAERGHRVLAVAAGPVVGTDEQALRGLRLLGLAGLMDPPREGARAAVAACQKAGITVAMITGDHPKTALAIAGALGIAGADAAELTGAQLKQMDDAALRAALPGKTVFARIEPMQKFRLVRAWQDLGHFVAVTGDGVNDAPALRRAHIGVAMGRSGTDIARDAADIVLTDDNFASLAAGVEEGRFAYANLRKVIALLLTTGAAEVMLFLLATLAGMPLPLTALQLLWLNLVTNGIQHLALSFEKGEAGVLDDPPRKPSEPLFNRAMAAIVGLNGLWIAVVSVTVFHFLLEAGHSHAEAQNHLLWLLVLFENAFVFAARSERRAFYRVPLANNWLLLYAVMAAQGLHLAAAYIPGLNAVLGLTPLSFQDWLVLAALGLSVLAFSELVKKIILPRIDPRPQRA